MVSTRKVAEISKKTRIIAILKDKENDKYPNTGEIRTIAIAL